MTRLVLHWTAGQYLPNSVDLRHYHYLIDGKGRIIPAVPVERNVPRLQPGYAAHTRGLNTGSIGLAVCCAQGAIESPLDFGDFPPNGVQLWALAHLAAKLCTRYNIPVDREHVLTHGEVQTVLGVRQRGKWDLNYLPHRSGTGGDWLRKFIKTFL